MPVSKLAQVLLAVPALALTACGSTETAAPAVTVTVTERAPAATPTPAVTTPAPVITTEPRAPVTTTAPPVEAAPPPAPVGFVMPDLVGNVLQDAQDEMQRVVGSFFYSTSHDADGQGRAQLIDSNWKVCDQSPAAGTPISSNSPVDFGAVKLDESCP